ncbi:MAG: 30S ribosomal protein S20 [candidate division Zixibacteria bacterium]|nr:30S ribosomal protein S20 [candidate division Zixibacteria bacterium]
MAKHLSVKKRHRQSLVHRARNRAAKSRIRLAIRQASTAETSSRPSALRDLASVVDRAAAQKVIHRNKAARIKSRLSRRLAPAKSQ